MVESGNGRTIALRRSADQGGAAYARYRAALEARGYDTGGMQAPVRVRVRTEPMTGAERAALTRDMNADVTERMSVPEQAAADVRSIDDAALSKLDGTPAGKRAFARAFLQKVAPDQVNSLVDAGGQLSKAGEDRVDAALVSRAFGDPRLVEAMFEAADPNIKGIGAALREVAPGWAAMRAAIDRGEIAPELDVTAQLRSAVDLVRHARDNRLNLSRLIAERLEQSEMFSGVDLSPETEAFLRLIFRNEGFTQPLAASKLAEALTDYTRLAGEYRPGPNLFGEIASANDARQLLEGLAAKFRDGDAAGPDGRDPDLLRPPGRADGADEPANEPGAGAGGAAGNILDGLFEPVERGGGSGEGLPPEGERGAESQGGADHAAAGEQRPDAYAAVLAADPELRRIAEANAALERELGEPAEPSNPAQDPATRAEAVRAAAVCLAGEL